MNQLSTHTHEYIKTTFLDGEVMHYCWSCMKGCREVSEKEARVKEGAVK